MITPTTVVFEEAVKIIEHGESVSACLVARRERYAVFHRMAKDRAGNGFTIRARRALCRRVRGGNQFRTKDCGEER
jgi:hypothetical protein